MKKYPLFILVSLLFSLPSCRSFIPDWVKETKHELSPDGRVLIYEKRLEGNHIAVGSWFQSNFIEGGTGIFDIRTNDTSGTNIIWLNESVVLIEYPGDSEIIGKADSSYFAGRTVYMEYQVKD